MTSVRLEFDGAPTAPSDFTSHVLSHACAEPQIEKKREKNSRRRSATWRGQYVVLLISCLRDSCDSYMILFDVYRML